MIAAFAMGLGKPTAAPIVNLSKEVDGNIYIYNDGSDTIKNAPSALEIKLNSRTIPSENVTVSGGNNDLEVGGRLEIITYFSKGDKLKVIHKPSNSILIGSTIEKERIYYFSNNDWYGNASSSEVDVRTTIDSGSLNLTGENAVGWWSMDDDSDNTAHDLTSLNNDGTINGATYVSGKFGNAIDFEGSNDSYIQVQDDDSLDFDGNDDFTISVWIKTTANGYIASKVGVNAGQYYYLCILGGRLTFKLKDVYGNNPGIDVAGVTDGNWHHVIAKRNAGDNLAIYVDGQLVESTSDTTTGSLANSRPFEIGISRWNAPSFTYPLDGKIDEVRVYNRALSEDKIERIYNRTKPSSITGSSLETGT